MTVSKKDILKKNKRKLRVKSRLSFGTNDRPRVAVFRSLKHLYAQFIDDNVGNTLVSCSTLVLNNVTGNKKDRARIVGLELAKLATQKGITKAFLDRGSYRYLGRVSSFTDGLREGGITI